MKKQIVQAQVAILASLIAGQVCAFDLGGLVKQVGAEIAKNQPAIASGQNSQDQINQRGGSEDQLARERMQDKEVTDKFKQDVSARKKAEREQVELENQKDREESERRKQESARRKQESADLYAKSVEESKKRAQEQKEAREKERLEIEQRRADEDQARRDQAQKEMADAKAKRLANMQTGYALRTRKELSTAFNSCMKEEKTFESGYIALLEELAQQSATVSERNDLQQRAADWKKNIGSTVPAMCLSRMNTALLSVASSGRMTMAEIAANTTEKGFELVRPILAMKPSVFYMLVNTMGAMQETAIHSSQMQRVREEIERHDGRPNFNEAYAAFENLARANAELVTSFMSGEIH